MKDGMLRAAVMVVLGLLILGFLFPEKPEEEAEGITVLEPCEETEEVCIHICSAVALRQRDGRYLIEVTFTTDLTGELKEMWMVTVFCQEQRQTFSLTKDNQNDVHMVSFLTPAQPETVKVEVRYHQTEPGLLLMSDGEGRLCAQTVAPVNGERILMLSGGEPGSAYTIYWVAELYELLSGMVILNLDPTAEDLDFYGVKERYRITLIADDKGDAYCNFTAEGLADGVYLVTGEAGACYVCLPQVEASGEFRSSVTRLLLVGEQGDAT